MNKRDTLRDLFSIQERVNRLFEDAMGGVKPVEETGVGTWSPAVDICETESEFVVDAELPEVRRSDIDIKVQDNTLTLEGERRLHREMMEGYHRIERSFGRFSRSFLLPVSVNQEAITATLREGILRIVLPKTVEPAPKQIKITERE